LYCCAGKTGRTRRLTGNSAGPLPAVPKPGIDHVVIYGSESIGESETGIIEILGLQFPTPQQNLFRYHTSLDQAQLIMDDGKHSADIHVEAFGDPKTDISPEFQVVL